MKIRVGLLGAVVALSIIGIGCSLSKSDMVDPAIPPIVGTDVTPTTTTTTTTTAPVVNSTTTTTAKPVVTTTTTSVDRRPWMEFSSEVDAYTKALVKQAVKYARSNGLSTVCNHLNVSYKEDPKDRSWAYTTSSGDCAITYDRTALTGDWGQEYIVYHEVTHIFSPIGAAHGPVFRHNEAIMYRNIHLRVEYSTADQVYPDKFWKCVAGC